MFRLGRISACAFALLCSLSSWAQGQWQLLGDQNLKVLSVAETDSAIYVGTRYSGVLYSTDTGQTWDSLNTGLYSYVVSGQNTINVPGMAATSTELFAATTDTIYAFNTSVGKWQPRHAIEIGPVVSSYRGLYVNNDVLFAQIFDYNDLGRVSRSDDGGFNFTSIPNAKAMSFYGEHAYFCSFNKVYHSADNGATYQQVTTSGLPSQVFFQTLVAKNDSVVLLANESGPGAWEHSIFESASFGNNWDSIAPNNHNFRLMVADGAFMLGTGDYTYIYYSTDGGHTWAITNSGFTSNPYINKLLLTPSHAYAATEWGVYRMDRSTFTAVPTTAYSASALHAYPNPFDASITLSVSEPKDVLRVALYDAQGSEVLTSSDMQLRTIPTHTLPNGVYVLRAIFKNGTVQQLKLMK